MSPMVVAFSIVGAVLLAFVAIQMVLVILSSVSGLSARRQQHQQASQLFQERINSIKAQRVRDQGKTAAWNGFRKFVVKRKSEEANGICSFYLAPHDRKPLPSFKPGQFLTFRLDIPGQEKPAIRCYSLSDSPRSEYYRVTIKRVGSPPDQPDIPVGLVSNYFNDQCCEGDILDVKAPAGNFVLHESHSRPAVLIAGGVGITPLLSMINSIAEEDSKREVWLFYGVRRGDEHAMKEHLRNLCQEHDNLRVITAYSEPTPSDVEGRDYNHQGHISISILKQYFESNNYQFYVCGPPVMMSAISRQLTMWGVPSSDIFTEAFGPASVKATKDTKSKPAETLTTQHIKVKFDKCNKDLVWDVNADNLLEFGEENGVSLLGGCRAGSCGTCEIALISGEVNYNQEPEYPDLKEGCCLTCVGVPKGDVVLDA